MSLDEQVRRAGRLLAWLGVDVTDPPTVTESKSVRYVTATATAPGDTTGVARHVVDGLSADGWSVWSDRPLDLHGSPTTSGHEVVAEKDGVVAMLAVFDRLGTRPAPVGTRWVQLSLAEPDDALAWTQRRSDAR
ncbi:MAG TPA: hypothetical protein VF519_15935 [Mycobacteriales bacterium]